MVYILLGAGFEEAEALVTADVLRRGGVPVTLAGLDRRTVTGAHDITVVGDAVAADITLTEGDMVLLPGGMAGVAAIAGCETALALIRQAAQDDGLWLAAICAAPTLPARLGLLRGKQAVCYPGMEQLLIDGGALPQMGRAAVRDGRLITGRGPGAAFDFGLAVLDALAGVEAAAKVRAETHYRT